MKFRTSIMLLAAGCIFLSGCSAWRVFFPSRTYETTPPQLPVDLSSPAMLVFSKTNGWRHEEAIPAAHELFARLGQERGLSVFATENGAVFNRQDLARFDVVVWNNTSGDTLNEEQKKAWQDWLREGGGAIAIHGAGGDPSYDWDWHPQEFIRAQFIGHTM
ncbi:MAG: ThuA domain-containing protein, partial [Deltaproteobacteria bacterium]